MPCIKNDTTIGWLLQWIEKHLNWKVIWCKITFMGEYDPCQLRVVLFLQYLWVPVVLMCSWYLSLICIFLLSCYCYPKDVATLKIEGSIFLDTIIVPGSHTVKSSPHPLAATSTLPLFHITAHMHHPVESISKSEQG